VFRVFQCSRSEFGTVPIGSCRRCLRLRHAKNLGPQMANRQTSSRHASAPWTRIEVCDLCWAAGAAAAKVPAGKRACLLASWAFLRKGKQFAPQGETGVPPFQNAMSYDPSANTTLLTLHAFRSQTRTNFIMLHLVNRILIQSLAVDYLEHFNTAASG
jgi:hypothetical protein